MSEERVCVVSHWLLSKDFDVFVGLLFMKVRSCPNNFLFFLHKGCFLQQRPHMTWISMDTWFSKTFRCVFFRILIWIQLPEGRLAGVTWMWHTDPRWSGIVSCLLEWRCHFTNVLGHQLLYRLIMHNTRGCIWPPNSTDNELFKGHLQKIYKYCQAVDAMGNRHNV